MRKKNLSKGAHYHTIVKTKYGELEGYIDKATKTLIWKAVPFAKPPVGNMRWRAPQDPEPWHGIRTAMDECTPCMQLNWLPSWQTTPEIIGSEDCLYMNIYRPNTSEEDLPVYVWIHGGGNINGFADQYPMGNLSRETNSVIVVIQYRLHVFGFLSHPALRSGADLLDDSGNYGILDQIKALGWVRDNIATFGGDPNRVTIGGESAGAADALGLMISPLAKGLFHGALLESVGMVTEPVAEHDEIANRTIETALIMKGMARDTEEAKSVLEKMSNDLIASLLQGLSSEATMQAHAGGLGQLLVPLAHLITDGHVIPDHFICAVESGKYNKVPILMGTNTDEYGSLLPQLPSLKEGMPDYTAAAEILDGKKNLKDVLPTVQDRDWFKKVVYYGTHLYYTSPHLAELAPRLRNHQKEVYVYSFKYGQEEVRGDAGFIYGAGHASELPFFHSTYNDQKVIDTWNVFKGYRPESLPGREALSETIVKYEANFLRTGNPNEPESDLPEWKPWSNQAGESKRWILDADLNRTDIRMDSIPIPSVADIRKALDAEDPSLRDYVLFLVGMITPVSAYEKGDYEFPKCNY